jgi:outer membrane protein OmpA-like peptidoglycan-associated protein
MLHNVTFRRLLQLKAGKHILEDSMSSRPKPRISLPSLSGLFLMFALVLVSSLAVAQSDSNPKWDLFVGYQWLHPGGTVPAAFGDPAAPTPFKVPDMDKGFGSALTYNFDRYWGLEADFGHNWARGNYETTGSAGPRFMVRTDGANYFLHGLVSYNRLSVSGLNPSNGIGAILGGGMDLPIWKTVSLRVAEVDYVWARHNFADNADSQFPSLRRPSFEGIRLRTGLVFNWGGTAELIPAVSCSVQPTEVMVGEPITATASASNFNPKHPVTYNWSGNGGQVTGKDSTATIDTTNATPGNYAVKVQVTDSKAKKNNQASCSANYTVKPLPPKNPPTISCSASPATVVAGGTSTITCNASSPDNVSVKVANWTSNAGTISGRGSSATLNTNGVSPGSITVSATATDTRGLSAQASTAVEVQNPPRNPQIEVLEQRLALHSIYFPTAQPPASNPKGGLVPSQQQTLLGLATDFKAYVAEKPDAHLILEGHADERGSDAFNQALTERRVARVKSFLVENGIPEANIETVAYGKQHNLTTEEVRQSIESNPELSPEERQRSLKNITILKWASNRRVDVTLKAAGQTQTSVRQYPFNAADSLTLIGGRESQVKKKAAKPGPRKQTKPPVKKPQ